MFRGWETCLRHHRGCASVQSPAQDPMARGSWKGVLLPEDGLTHLFQGRAAPSSVGTRDQIEQTKNTSDSTGLCAL